MVNSFTKRPNKTLEIFFSGEKLTWKKIANELTIHHHKVQVDYSKSNILLNLLLTITYFIIMIFVWFLKGKNESEHKNTKIECFQVDKLSRFFDFFFQISLGSFIKVYDDLEVGKHESK